MLDIEILTRMAGDTVLPVVVCSISKRQSMAEWGMADIVSIAK